MSMFRLSPPATLCVVRLSSVGDTCHALAVVRAIQDTWPETRITWIIGKAEAALLSDIADIEFIIFDKSAGAAGYREIRHHLCGRSYDAVLCMHASLRANLIYPLIRSKHKIGYDFARARDGQWLLTRHRILPVPRQHVLDGMMAFARFLGVGERPLRWDIPLSDAHRDFAAQYRSEHQPLFLISPCSSQRSRNYRNWSVENYAAAARHALHKFDCRVLITGGASAIEQDYGQAITRLAGGGVENLVGQTSLKQLLALIDAADALLCPDSGPAHLATAVRTPVIGLYATSNPERTGPYLCRNLTINAYPEASRTFLGKEPDALRWGERVREPRAMGLIRLGRVNAAIDALLSPAAGIVNLSR